MPTPATGTGGTVCCRGQEPADGRGVACGMVPGVGEARRGRSGRDALASFSYRVRESNEVIFVGMGGQRACVAHQLPAARRGDPAGVRHAQIPRVRLTNGGERPHYGR